MLLSWSQIDFHLIYSAQNPARLLNYSKGTILTNTCPSLCLEICCKQHSTSQVINLSTLSPYTDSIFQSPSLSTSKPVSLQSHTGSYSLNISLILWWISLQWIHNWKSEQVNELWPVLLTEWGTWSEHMYRFHLSISIV
jgi:hypothetical protein